MNTNSSGVATAPAFTANGTTGAYIVTAKTTSPALGPVNFSLTNALSSNNFTNAGGDNQWTTLTNWSLGHVPLSTEIVSDTAGLNITLGSGGQTVAAMMFTNGGTLTISGGTLAITGTSTASGLNISGGTLITNGVLTVNSASTLSAGTLNGSNVAILFKGLLTWSGGTMMGNGTTTIGGTGSLIISGSGTKTLTQRPLILNGPTTYNGTGPSP